MKLNIQATERGIEHVDAHVSSVSEANEAGLISAAIALPLSLLDRTLRETKVPACDAEGAVEPLVWIARADELGSTVFESQPLHVAPPLRGLFAEDAAPSWFTECVHAAFPDDPSWEYGVCLDTAAELVIHLPWANLARTGWSLASSGRDEVVLVSECAFLDAASLTALADFCGKAGLQYAVFGWSYSDPSAHFRIEVFPASVSAAAV